MERERIEDIRERGFILRYVLRNGFSYEGVVMEVSPKRSDGSFDISIADKLGKVTFNSKEIAATIDSDNKYLFSRLSNSGINKGVSGHDSPPLKNSSPGNLAGGQFADNNRVDTNSNFHTASSNTQKKKERGEKK